MVLPLFSVSSSQIYLLSYPIRVLGHLHVLVDVIACRDMKSDNCLKGVTALSLNWCNIYRNVILMQYIAWVGSGYLLPNIWQSYSYSLLMKLENLFCCLYSHGPNLFFLVYTRDLLNQHFETFPQVMFFIPTCLNLTGMVTISPFSITSKFSSIILMCTARGCEDNLVSFSFTKVLFYH